MHHSTLRCPRGDAGGEESCARRSRHSAAAATRELRDRTTIDYKAAVNGSLQLVPAGESLVALGANYSWIVDDGVLLEDAEPFGALIERCADIAARANRAAE
jgi:hypothetical protein